MKYLHFFRKLFSYYFILIFTTTLYTILFCQFEIEIAFNFIENCLFAFLLITLSFFFKKANYRKLYGLFSFVFFSTSILFESVYYLLFQVFFSASSIFVLLDSNFNESLDFINFYIGYKEIFLIISIIIYSFYIFRILNNCNYEINTPLKKKGFIYILTIVLIFTYLKVSKNIIYNFPYLFSKSFIEYYQTSSSFDNYSSNSIGSFTNVKSISNEDNPVYVLILGESTVRSHMQLYGYERSTTPFLNQISKELLVFSDVISPHTLTVESINKMLTLTNYESEDNKRSGSILQLANAAGYNTYWLSNQRPIGIFESLVTKIALSASETSFVSTAYGQHNRTLDQSLIPKIRKVLKDSNKFPKFIVVHLMGAHFKYENRYPDSMKTAFKSIESDRILTQKQLIQDEYDRAILNTDYVITEIIKSVKKYANYSAVLYVSDHGEELDDLERLGHNEDFATKSMYDIPFFLWQSEAYKKDSELFFDPNRKYMTDDLFHSLAEILEINANEVDFTRSIFSKYFQSRPRVILNNQDYDIKF